MNQPYQTSGPRYDLSTLQHTHTHTSCILHLHPSTAAGHSNHVWRVCNDPVGRLSWYLSAVQVSVCPSARSSFYKEETNPAALQRAPSPRRFTAGVRRQWGFNYLGILMGD